ncbi:tumor-associated protein [Musa troglodytarum]|uniref:Tumor-associated protein n=1 Tax=Musa troglodytarum TaxID=320322 RepID=A0A9E7KNI6_9LILI|nr:tumor-associated protein [Musa troglodytarum]
MEALHFCNALKMPFISFWNSAKESLSSVSHLWGGIHSLIFWSAYDILNFEHLKSFAVQWLERRSKAFEPTYLYTTEKGYFLLSEGAKSRHDIRTVNATISAQSTCFGNRWQQLLINSFVGYDTILMNSLLSSPGHDYFVTKCGVLIMSLFVFFTTTMSVSFTLRETQSRMLRFTVQLQHHARNHLPTFQLIFVHVIESLIMIGILFFLFEFYDDQLLAFLVLTLVWLCELFTMISVRTTISMQFFPRFFLLYFLVPALQRFMRARAQLQQQTGVQITSSTIYTSTLHIARLSLPNGDVADAEPRTTAQASAGTNPAGVSDPGGLWKQLQVSNLNSHQTAGALLALAC